MRRSTIQPETILKAAREVFLKHGMNARTIDVARRAGVSEGSIFVHFGSKENLFRAVLDTAFTDKSWVDEMRNPCEDQDVKAIVGRTLEKGVEHFRRQLPLILMQSSNPSLQSAKRVHGTYRGGEELYIMEGFFRFHMERQTLRPCKAPAVADLLLSSCLTRILNGYLSPTAGNAEQVPILKFVEETVDLLWNGVKA